VASNAVQMAVGLGARVTVLDHGLERMRKLDALYGNRIATLAATADNIEQAVLDADLVIGAVLVPGAAAPHLVGRATVARMRRGAVVVDVAIDQGGCFETSRPTTHAHPAYVEEGVVHYCVTNMPGAVPRTATFALTNATLPFILALADKGWRQAMRDDPHLRAGLNVCNGEVTCKPVALALGYAWRDPETVYG
jgi:alanine dehydrogenase